jgi:hypothetical protein
MPMSGMELGGTWEYEAAEAVGGPAGGSRGSVSLEVPLDDDDLDLLAGGRFHEAFRVISYSAPSQSSLSRSYFFRWCVGEACPLITSRMSLDLNGHFMEFDLSVAICVQEEVGGALSGGVYVADGDHQVGSAAAGAELIVGDDLGG